MRKQLFKELATRWNISKIMLLIKFQEYFKKIHSVLGPLDKFVGNHNGLVVICFEETFLVRYTDAYTLFSQKIRIGTLLKIVQGR